MAQHQTDDPLARGKSGEHTAVSVSPSMTTPPSGQGPVPLPSELENSTESTPDSATDPKRELSCPRQLEPPRSVYADRVPQPTGPIAPEPECSGPLLKNIQDLRPHSQPVCDASMLPRSNDEYRIDHPRKSTTENTDPGQPSGAPESLALPVPYSTLESRVFRLLSGCSDSSMELGQSVEIQGRGMDTRTEPPPHDSIEESTDAKIRSSPEEDHTSGGTSLGDLAQTHGDGSALVCRTCHVRFPSKSTLHAHLRVELDEPEDSSRQRHGTAAAAAGLFIDTPDQDPLTHPYFLPGPDEEPCDTDTEQTPPEDANETEHVTGVLSTARKDPPTLRTPP